tara:strand:+ start:319131 stop:319661 length:531 start_codon:yes stop_codon:yes gene_type:complete
MMLLLFTAGATSANADWREMWHKMHVGLHRNNAWPDPFREIDAMQVVAPFDAMKRNGWRLQNTVGHELFREGDGALLAAGSNRVRWIATQAPEARRQVFVLRGRSESETEARVASVRETLASVRVSGATPSVLVTDIVPPSSSGARATQINRAWMTEMPKPKLPSTSAAGTASATN